MQIRLKNIPVSKAPKEYARDIVKDFRTQLSAGNNIVALQKELEQLSLKLGEKLEVVFDITIRKVK